MFRGITRNIYLLGLLAFFNDLTSDMITPLLPAFIAGMGLGAGFLGAMEGVANFLSHITVLFSGVYSDRVGKNKKIAMFGYRLSTISRLFIAIPHPFVTMAVRLIDRIGKGIRTAPRDSLITVSLEKRHWGQGFGVHRAMDHAGALLAGPLASLIILVFQVNLSTLFLVASIPAVLSVLIVPRYIHEGPKAPPVNAPRLSWKQLPLPLKKYLIVIFLAALATPSELFLFLRMKELGMVEFQMPLAWFVMTLFTMLAAFLGGQLADRWSRRLTIATGWFLFAVVYVAFAFVDKLTVCWPLIALYGIHMGIVEASERAYPATIASQESRAQALGWFYFAYGIGLLPASLIFGLLWDVWSFRGAFLLYASFTLITILFLFFLPSDRKKR